MKYYCKLFLPFLGLFFFGFELYAQGVPIGQWRDHLPYNDCISVTESNNGIYCATNYGIMFYNNDDKSLTRLTKVEGLSDILISTINFNKKYNTLVIAYQNANIDLLVNNTIINISDIKQKSILGLKTINNIYFIDKYAYLSCGFGIVVLDLVKKEIQDTYYIGLNGASIDVCDITTDGSNLYAATANGIYKASLSSTNLADYHAWIKDTLIFSPNVKYNVIEYFGNKLFVNKYNSNWSSDTIYTFDGKKWTYFNTPSFAYTNTIRSYNNKILIARQDQCYIYDSTLTNISTIWTYNPASPSAEGASTNINGAIISTDNSIWIADAKDGLIKNWNLWNYEKFMLNGPYSANVEAISVEGDKLWVASGGRDDSWGAVGTYNGVYSFIDEKWNSLNPTNNKIFDTINDIICVAVDPNNANKVYAGTWSSGVNKASLNSGLIEITNGNITNFYNTKNSTLQSPEGYTNLLRIGGLCFDSNDNLWITNAWSTSLLTVRMNDGTWKTFNFGALYADKIIIDEYDQKWIILGRGGGLLVFSDNNTITNTSDDQVKILTTDIGNGALPSMYVYSISQDQSGDIWVGTDQGITVFYNPGNVFTNQNFDSQQILVEFGGYAQYLLASETVTAIAVDGSNQKWVGTENSGVFLLSADGQQQLLHFTSDNSPLFSNTITSIAINGTTGEVFFGTSDGIVSYKGTETEPESQYAGVYAYPNPVKENYNGVIAIKGLMANTDVKITDVAGALVYSTKAVGGQAIWDGRNMSGEKIQTGVYLVFCSNTEGKETVVTKILVIN